MVISLPTLKKAYFMLIDQENQKNLDTFASSSSPGIKGTSLYSQKSISFSGGTGTSNGVFSSPYSGGGVSGAGREYNVACGSSGSGANNFGYR